jgi:hypothetical protein
MEHLLFIVLAPWLTFVVLAIIACWLVKLARKRKNLAFAFGVLLQIFMPVPQTEQTVKAVQVDKRVVKRSAKQKELKRKNSNEC